MTTAEAISEAISEMISEMMRVWAILESAARAQHPNASDEVIYKITSAAMTDQLSRRK
jgi:hypothetical protein